MVKVPNFSEFTANKISELAYQNSEIAQYLPEYNPKRPLNRNYLFNVNHTSLLILIDCEHCRWGILQ